MSNAATHKIRDGMVIDWDVPIPTCGRDERGHRVVFLGDGLTFVTRSPQKEIGLIGCAAIIPAER